MYLTYKMEKKERKKKKKVVRDSLAIQSLDQERLFSIKKCVGILRVTSMMFYIQCILKVEI